MLQLYKDTSHKDPPKDYSPILCFICQELGHMSHNCPRVQDRNFSNIFHWNADTEAMSHMTLYNNWIRNYRPYRMPVKLADYRIIYSKGIRSILFRPVKNGKKYKDVEFTRILHVPAFHNNLLSVLYLTKYKGIDVHISAITRNFFHQKSWLFSATINDDNDLGYLNGSIVDIMESVQLAFMLSLDLSLWHKWLEYHNSSDICKMILDELVDGLVLEPDPICKLCLVGQMHANLFLSSEHCTTEVLELPLEGFLGLKLVDNFKHRFRERYIAIISWDLKAGKRSS